MWSFFILYSTTSISTSTAVMKTYELGTVGDRNVTVKKIGGEYVVTIRVKDAELKNVQLPPKRQVFLHRIFNLSISRISTPSSLFVSYIVFPLLYCLSYTLFPCYRWAALRQCVDDVNTAVKTMREGGDVKMQHHIGGAYYVSVTSGYSCVDLRKFYQPYDSKDGQIKPTKRGVALRFDEWSTLCQLIATINDSYPSLANTVPCYYNDDHMNQLGWLNCVECHPFYVDLSQPSTA